MTRVPHPTAQQLLQRDALRYARASNAWTARALRLRAAGQRQGARDALIVAASYRARIPACRTPRHRPQGLQA